MLSVVAVCSSMKLLQKSNDGNINENFGVCWCFILGLKALVLIAHDEEK